MFIHIYIYLGSRFQCPGLESWNLPECFRRPKRFLSGSSFKQVYDGLQSSFEMALRRLLGVPGTLSGVLGAAKNIDFVQYILQKSSFFVSCSYDTFRHRLCGAEKLS